MVDRETRRQRIAQAQKFIRDDPYVSSAVQKPARVKSDAGARSLRKGGRRW